MRTTETKLFLLFIAFAFSFHGYAQDSLPFELSYQINKVYPSISITKEKSKVAESIADLNQHYKPSWVKEYISVEISASTNGKINMASSEDDKLTDAQKDIINTVDVGTDVSVHVKYIPENNLVENEPKENNFTFTVDPENVAEYPGGEQKLQQYIQEKAATKIANSSFKQHQLTVVKFSIDEEGKVIDAEVAETSQDEKVDEILVETICNMPDWKPATYANGVKVKQEYVLTAGDMNSCITNLYNIRVNNRTF